MWPLAIHHCTNIALLLFTCMFSTKSRSVENNILLNKNQLNTPRKHMTTYWMASGLPESEHVRDARPSLSAQFNTCTLNFESQHGIQLGLRTQLWLFDNSRTWSKLNTCTTLALDVGDLLTTFANDCSIHTNHLWNFKTYTLTLHSALNSSKSVTLLTCRNCTSFQNNKSTTQNQFQNLHAAHT